VNEEVLYELAARVEYGNARRYVLSRGWAQSTSRRMDIGIFRLGKLGREHEAVLPMDTSLRDYMGAMIQFARRVAEAEGRAVEQVLRDLVATNVDRHRPARLGAPDASLEAALSMLEGIQRALLASACSVLQARPFHPRMTLSEAEAFMSATRFTSTEVGSFVMVIDTPLEVDHARPGFGREASLTLMRSLAHIAGSIRVGSPERIVNPQVGEPTVSSNLCEAILRMAPQSEAADLRFAVSWSPLMAPPVDVLREISIDRTMYEPLERAASQLRPSPSTERSWHFGYIKELKGTPSADGPPEGEAVLSLLMEDGTMIRARAILDAGQYQTAILAHGTSRPLVMEAELHRVRRGSELRKITSFELLQNESTP
jgi:hypothetical protein